jgi:hypothetical protein
MRLAPCVPLCLLLACETSKISLGAGPSNDARLYSDIYTWQCEDRTTGDVYEAVFDYHITLEYAPDQLQARSLPPSGCSKGLDLFPADAGEGAEDLPGVDEPSWRNDAASLSGSLPQLSEGYYYDDVYDNVSNCSDAEEFIAEGTSISDAASFSGAATPTPGRLGGVTFSPDPDTEAGFTEGEEYEISWENTGWDTSWVMIRRESSDGTLQDSLTCITEGDASFTLDTSVWDQLSSTRVADVTNVYVALQNDSTQTAEDDQKIELYSRVITAAVVH